MDRDNDATRNFPWRKEGAKSKNAARNKRRLIERLYRKVGKSSSTLLDKKTCIYLLSNDQYSLLRQKCTGGTVVLKQKMVVGSHHSRRVFWRSVKGIDLHNSPVEITKSYCILTDYSELKDDESILFVGNYQGSSTPLDTKAVLAIIIQPESNEDVNTYSNRDFHFLKRTKPDIGGGSKTKKGFHFKSLGSYFAFGSRAAYAKDKETGASVALYASKKTATTDDDSLLQILKEKCITTLSYAKKTLTEFVGSGDIVKASNAPLKGMVLAGREYGFDKHIGLLGLTEFCTAYFNFDASTLIPHTEVDWTYTLLTVPKQEEEKDANCPTHMKFRLHLNGT